MMVVKPVFIVMVCVVFLMFSFSVCLSDEWGTVSFQKDESDSIQELEQAFDGTSHPAFIQPFYMLDRLWFYDGLVMPGTYGLYGSITQLPLANRTFLPASEKDPFIAGLLSWFMMGMGQIYAHEYTKGSIFIAANLASKLSLVLLISHINTKYSPGGNEIINIDWKSFDSSTKFLIIGYFATSFGLRVYNVVDAVKSAREYNERFFSQKGENGFSFSIDPERVSINLSFD